MYGAAPPKLKKMLGLTDEAAEKMWGDFWDSVKPLKELRDKLTEFWEATEKAYIPGVDGRKIRVRSQHSLINALFQSAGAIAAKWCIVRVAQKLEELNLLGDPFKHTKEDVKVWQMIVYHDEAQYALPKDMYSCTFFDTEEEAEAYRVESGSHTNYHFSEKANKFYISEPNLLTEAILDSIDKAIDFLNVKVYLGMEYEIGRCWRDCH